LLAGYHCFNGISAAIDGVVAAKLGSLPCIAGASEAVQHTIKGVCINKATVLLKLDIKDLYMSSTHHNIVGNVCKLFEDDPALRD